MSNNIERDEYESSQIAADVAGAIVLLLIALPVAFTVGTTVFCVEKTSRFIKRGKS